jgi:dienelactone hydrolase
MPRSIRPSAIAFAIVLAALAAPAAGPQPASPGQVVGRPAPEAALAAQAKELQIREGLVVGLLGSYGRNAVPTDFLAWQIATGAFREPREGDVLGPDDRNRTQTWARAEAGADGWFQNRSLNNGYLYTVVNSERPRTMILEASGFYVARVNGEPRGGEKYGTDWVRHPVSLRQGRNILLFQGERGRFRARLVDPPAPAFFAESDPTLPDLVVGQPGPFWMGVRLVNATPDTLDAIEVAYRVGGQAGTTKVAATVPPFMARKLAVRLDVTAPRSEGVTPLELKATMRAGRRAIEAPAAGFPLKTVPPTAHFAKTFVSEIDGSVQYYGVAPLAGGPASPGPVKPALVVSLHGAGVEAIGQARAYKPKDWAYIVAPTNRRPYGFDWEDWGRLDALEAAADASRAFGTDAARTYLTGHSMGGHGTWQIGATTPDPWAAIAPSAGWHSFSSYGGGAVFKDPNPIEKMLARANQPGETTALSRNFLHYGVYVLHGDKDDNVPVAQARYMRELLAKFHPDFAYYERPGAGHWWGDECVDWPPLFEFLKGHLRPSDADTTRVDFVTANPGIASTSRWVAVLGQEHPLEYSRVAIDRDAKTGAFKGTTENVLRLSLAPAAGAGGVAVVDLDGSKLEVQPAADGRLYLERRDATWQVSTPPAAGLKGPHRGGGFKDAFRHRVVFVYGTLGTAEENARAFDKARMDAEAFWYRGNASVDVVPDRLFDPSKEPDRNVVLYGNADTNAHWVALLGGGPVEVRTGRARVGDRAFQGADLAACFVRPRPGSAVASVGAVAWSGPAGWTAAGPTQYFVSGAGFPDLMLFSADALRSGTSGVLAIGWFGDDWTMARGEFAWAPARAR